MILEGPSQKSGPLASGLGFAVKATGAEEIQYTRVAGGDFRGWDCTKHLGFSTHVQIGIEWYRRTEPGANHQPPAPVQHDHCPVEGRASGSSCSPSSVSRLKGCMGGHDDDQQVVMRKDDKKHADQHEDKMKMRLRCGFIMFHHASFLFYPIQPRLPLFFQRLCPDRKARRERKRLEEKLKARRSP